MERNGGMVRRLVGSAWNEAKGSLYRNAFFLMLSSVLASGLGFFFWIIVIQVYSDTDIGAAIILFQTLSFLATLGLLGLNVGIVRYLPDAEDKAPLINSALTVTGIACLALSVAFLVSLPLWSPDLTFVLGDPLYILTIIAATIVLGFAPILDQTAIAARRADISTWRNAIFAVLKIPMALIIAQFLAGRAGVFLSLAFSFGLSVLIAGFLFLPWILRGYWPRPRLRMDGIRPMMHFSLGNYAAAVIGSAGTMLLPLLIDSALGPARGHAFAAYFYVALVVAGLLYIIPGATFTSFYAEASHRGTDARGGERKAILLTLGLLLPAIAVMLLFSDTMLVWFGKPAYRDQAVTPLRILSFASIPAFLNGILGTRVRVRKQTRPLIIAAAIATGITLGMGWYLLQVPGLDIDGLAIAFVIGQAAATPYLYYVAREAYEAIPQESVFTPPME